jgi:hypothetical protein
LDLIDGEDVEKEKRRLAVEMLISSLRYRLLTSASGGQTRRCALARFRRRRRGHVNHVAQFGRGDSYDNLLGSSSLSIKRDGDASKKDT